MLSRVDFQNLTDSARFSWIRSLWMPVQLENGPQRLCGFGHRICNLVVGHHRRCRSQTQIPVSQLIILIQSILKFNQACDIKFQRFNSFEMWHFLDTFVSKFRSKSNWQNLTHPGLFDCNLRHVHASAQSWGFDTCRQSHHDFMVCWSFNNKSNKIVLLISNEVIE